MVVKEVTQMQQIFLRCFSSQIEVPSSVPVIRVPTYIKKYVEQAKKKETEKLLNMRRRITYRGNTSFPVISCTDKQYNFYFGQKYNQNYPIPLISKYWMKRKSSGQKFTINPWDTNPSIPVLYNEKHKNEAGFPRTYLELLSDENLLQELKNKGFESPTPVQVLTMPAILERKHVLLAAETGCGKTIAYLAPIIQNISSVKKRTKLFPNTPLALILTPGRELAEQIGSIAYDLSKNTDLNVCALVTDGSRNEHLRLTENADVDILVASIGILSKLVQKKIFALTNLRHLVLDEADTLMDDSFIEDTERLLRRIPLFIDSTENLPPEDGTQLILVSSTYPIAANHILPEMFEEDSDVIKIHSPYLHRVLCHIKQKFWRVEDDNRCGIVLDLAKSDHEKRKPLLIFATHYYGCNWLSDFLNDNGIPNVKFHGDMSSAKRAIALEKFTNGHCNVMCATDLASRGLDTQHVKHVINFDFPTSVSDYILRVGRVGRVGTNQGYVTNLVSSKAGVYAVQEIEEAVRSSVRIPDVDANIKKKINKLYFSY